MNISYNWLKEYVDFDLSAEKVAEALTSVGLEVGGVEEVQTIKGGLKGLVVAKVLTCEPHPNSDHMHVTTVDLGVDEPVQIVCGAPNVAAGQKVIVATLGTVLYDGDDSFTIKKSKLRGVDSFGMICAEDEIGIGTSHDGIIVLPDDAVVGTAAADYYNIKSDYLIEVDITPNRADACSHYGVARDLYAWLVQNGYSTKLHRPSDDSFCVDDNSYVVDVEVADSEACPRYAAVSVTGCEVKPSPEWLQDKLRTIGVRPINNIVDITNYIMMAYGQPLHCFDADMIEGKKIVVRTMPEGTSFVTLDGVEHKLSERDLAICNANEPMCIAGVFGGKGSGTYETTTNVVFESAYFNPTMIRKSARRHGLNTDASFRFERGIDPAGQIYALKQAAIMAKELAGGKVSMQIVDIKDSNLKSEFDVEIEYSYINQLVGKDLSAETVKSIVTSLEMKIVSENEKGLSLKVPAYRVDVQRPCDVVEDILRIYGYNNVEIPSTLKSSLVIKGDADKSHRMQNVIGEQLVGCGFNEILNNSLTKSSYYDGLESYKSENLVRLMNPLSSDLNVLRKSLVFGGLECIAHNVNRRNGNIRFFEFGNCYSFDENKKSAEQTLAAYSEDFHLGMWVSGNRVSGSWAHADEQSSFYELKAYVMNVLARLGMRVGLNSVVEYESDIFSVSQAINNKAGVPVVIMGIISKKVTAKFDIEQDVFYADINWNLVMKAIRNNVTSFTEIAKFPAVSRDLALLVDKKIKFAEIELIAYQSEKKLLKNVTLFDVYEGKNLEAGKKSYAVNFTLQNDNATLNDKQIEKIMQNIINNLTKRLDAKLR